MLASKVLDSYALVAWLLDQAAAEAVDRLLDQAAATELDLLMSWVNVGEVYYMVARKKGAHAAESFLAELPELPLRLVLPSEVDFVAAARLKATRRMSYADGFAAALCMKYQAPIVTGDPEFRGLADVLTVEWIGGPV